MNRRNVLALGATTVIGFAGCLDTLDPRDPRDETDPWAGVEPRYPTDREVPSDASTHHLFVENANEDLPVITLTVVRVGDDELIWRNTYQMPDERGFEIPDLLVDGRTYKITLAFENGDRTTTERAVEPCPHEGGSRNVGAWIENGDVTFHQDSCDEIHVGASLPIGPHERFIVE